MGKSRKTKRVRVWLQECLICKYKARVKSSRPDAEDIIRATVLSCGHQGMFKLTEIENK